MPDIGVAPTPAMPDGEAKLQRLQQAGFTGPEMVTYKQQTSDKLRGAGFSPADIDHYWGDNPPKSPTLEGMARAAAGAQLHNVADTIRAVTTRAQQATAQYQKGLAEMGSAGQIAPGQSAQNPWDFAAKTATGVLDATSGAWSFMTSPLIGAVDAGPGKIAAKVPLPTLDADNHLTVAPVGPTFLGDQTANLVGLLGGKEAAEPAPISLPARAATIQAVTRGEIRDPGHMPAAVVGEPNVTAQMRAAVPSAHDYASAARSILPRPTATPVTRLYRQASADEAVETFLPHSNISDSGAQRDIFFARKPELATGQGGNTGVFMEFDSAGLRGRANTSKPVGGEDEFIGRLNTQSAYQNALLSIRVDDDAKTTGRRGAQLQDTLKRLTNEGWTVTKGDGFTTYTRPPKPPPEIDATAQARVTANLHRVWVETGLTPSEAIVRAKTDPVFRQELIAQDVNGDPVTPHYTAGAKPEPKPLVKAPTEAPPKATLLRPGEPARPPSGPTFVPSVDHAMGLLKALEGSGDQAVSKIGPHHDLPGAVGRYQVMPGTARQYDPSLRNLDDAEVRDRLKNPDYNYTIAHAVVSDLYRKYQGNMDAIAIAYNAGPKRANEYLTRGPGTRLEAIPDKTVRGGIRYVEVAAEKDESFLPLETQHYLANGRRRAGGPLSAEEGTGGEIRVPSYDENAKPASLEETSADEGETIKSGSMGAASVWDDAPIEDAQREVLSNIGEQPSLDWSKDLSPDAMADKLFAINPARRLDTALVQAKLLDRDTEFGIEDAFRQTFASDNRANVFVRYGQIDGPEGKNIIEGSSSLWDAVKAMKEDGGDPDGFRAWLMSKRTVEKGEQDIDTGVNPLAAARIVTDAAENKKYKRAGAMWTEVLNSTLDYAQRAGRYSAEQVQAMKDLNTTYVSFRRIMGDEKSFQAKSGYGFTLGNPLKRMEGSDKQIVDPLLASIDNMRLVIASADQNWARGHVVALAEANPEIAEALGLRKEDGVHTLNEDQIIKILAPYRDEMTSEEFETAVAGLRETADASLDKSLADNQFAYYRDGKREVWTVDSPEFAQMLRGTTDRAQVGLITKVFQVIAAGARSGIVMMPDFPLRNAVSHQLIQFINDPSHPPPFMAPIRGLMDVVGASEIYQDAMAKGAMGAAITDLDRDYLANDMAKLFHQTGVSDKVWNLVTAPFQAAQWAQERLDAANRVGLYKYGVENGLDAQKAAMRSRTAGIDYAEKLASSQLRWWAKVTPFFKARLLYLNQAAQAWKEHPGVTAAYATAAVALPATAMWAINQWQDQFLPEDRKFANIPRWEKDYALITPEIDGVRLKIRYPEGTGWLFGAMVTRSLDAMAGHDPEAMHDWWQGLLQQLPLEAPPAIQTPLENAFNYNLFTGQPMIPGSLADASTDMQYTENTTPLARAIGKLVPPLASKNMLTAELSPIAVDHLVAAWTGTAGQALLKLVGAPFSRPGPPMDIATLPVVRGFVVRNPGFNAQAVEDYYTEKARFDKAAADVSAEKRNIRSGDTIDLAQARREYAMARADYKLNQVSGALAATRSSIWKIFADPTMNDTEKRQHMEAIYVQEIQIAKTWTAQMRAMDPVH